MYVKSLLYIGVQESYSLHLSVYLLGAQGCQSMSVSVINVSQCDIDILVQPVYEHSDEPAPGQKKPIGLIPEFSPAREFQPPELGGIRREIVSQSPIEHLKNSGGWKLG